MHIICLCDSTHPSNRTKTYLVEGAGEEVEEEERDDKVQALLGPLHHQAQEHRPIRVVNSCISQWDKQQEEERQTSLSTHSTHSTPPHSTQPTTYVPSDKGEQQGHHVEQALGRLHLQALGREDLGQGDIRPKNEVKPLQDASFNEVVEALWWCGWVWVVGLGVAAWVDGLGGWVDCTCNATIWYMMSLGSKAVVWLWGAVWCGGWVGRWAKEHNPSFLPMLLESCVCSRRGNLFPLPHTACPCPALYVRTLRAHDSSVLRLRVGQGWGLPQ